MWLGWGQPKPTLTDGTTGKVSVIVISLNAAKTIERTLQSLCRQGYNDREIIVVDGGSTDSTVSIARQYANKIVVSGPGFAVQYEAGRKEVTVSPYVLLLASDEYAASDDFIETLLSELISDGEVVAVQARLMVDPEITRMSMFARAEQYRYSRTYSSLRGKPLHYLMTGCAIFRTSALEEIGGFRENSAESVDSDISIRLVERGHKLKLSDKAVAYHILDETMLQSLRKTFRGGKSFFFVWRTAGGFADEYVRSITPPFILIRAAKMGVASFLDTHSLFFSAFVFLDVLSGYTAFSLGIFASWLSSKLHRNVPPP